jgi:MFS family permease
MTTNAIASVPWYRSINRGQWNALLASNLGWMLDGYETYALILSVGLALRGLLDPSEFGSIPIYAGTVIGITLLGWGIGGMTGGILADYIGRKRTMILAILAYSLLTGLSAISWNFVSFVLLRFLVGIGLGSEWSTGASITAELWPDGARGKSGGLIQCGFGIGFFLASLIWVFVSPLGPDAWRYMYLVGILPGLFTLWIRRNIPESPMWERAHARRKAAAARKQRGAAPEADDHFLVRFTLVNLFADSRIRRRTLIVFLMSLATTLGFWAISTFVPPYVGSVAAKAGMPAQQWTGYTGMAYNIGSICGYISFGFLADVFGRKPIALLYFAMALIMTPVLFLWTTDLNMLLLAAAVNGAFTNAQYAWMPVWLPELFPTQLRATGVAFAFNSPRFIAFLGPILAGALIVHFGGYGNAAMSFSCIYVLGFVAALFLPETKGKPLPESI